MARGEHGKLAWFMIGAVLTASSCNWDNRSSGGHVEGRSFKSQVTVQRIIELAKTIDELNVRRGRLPRSGTELEEWLGERLPVTGWGDPMRYQLVDGEYYIVSTVTDGSNAIVYQLISTQSERKVVSYPF